MKTCPVCKTQLFDDAGTCFGCMHRFPKEPQAMTLGKLPEVPSCEVAWHCGRAEGEAAAEGAREPPASFGEGGARAKKDTDDDGGVCMRGWVVRLELRSPEEPLRSWVIELGPGGKDSYEVTSSA